MANKASATRALKEISKDAFIETLSTSEYHCAYIQAPLGYHWLTAEGHLHMVEVQLNIEDGYKKADLWEAVAKEVAELSAPLKCTARTCPSWNKQYGYCIRQDNEEHIRWVQENHETVFGDA